ncbi:hypothetical protein RUM43_010571 [Polyplax serrata]|uniref:Uncharacterized protein n=1 Tax=Polyplax serrata TaxID=468196 RepID=A0AAN8Q521_POLSC
MTGLNVELKPQKRKREQESTSNSGCVGEKRELVETQTFLVVACDGWCGGGPNFPLRRGKQHVLMENEKENLKATTKIKESFPSHPERIPKSEEKVPEAGDRDIPGRCHGA